MNEMEQKRVTLQETMSFLGAMANGVEELVGEASQGMAFIAGKKLGQKFAADSGKTNSTKEALDEVRKVLEGNDCLWGFEPFKLKSESSAFIEKDDGSSEVTLVFRECMIRQSLFRYGHAQRGSLCTMMYGFFSGAIETIMGRKSTLEIQHAGENACLKKLTIQAPEK